MRRPREPPPHPQSGPSHACCASWRASTQCTPPRGVRRWARWPLRWRWPPRNARSTCDVVPWAKRRPRCGDVCVVVCVGSEVALLCCAAAGRGAVEGSRAWAPDGTDQLRGSDEAHHFARDCNSRAGRHVRSLRRTAAGRRGTMATPRWGAPAPPRFAPGCGTCGSSPTRQAAAAAQRTSRCRARAHLTTTPADGHALPEWLASLARTKAALSWRHACRFARAPCCADGRPAAHQLPASHGQPHATSRLFAVAVCLHRCEHGWHVCRSGACMPPCCETFRAQLARALQSPNASLRMQARSPPAPRARCAHPPPTHPPAVVGAPARAHHPAPRAHPAHQELRRQAEALAGNGWRDGRVLTLCPALWSLPGASRCRPLPPHAPVPRSAEGGRPSTLGAGSRAAHGPLTPRRPRTPPSPAADRHLQPWVVPALAALVPHMHTRLTAAWERLQAPTGERPHCPATVLSGCCVCCA